MFLQYKMSKDSSSRYYQKTKKSYKKEPTKGIKIFLEKKKKNSDSIFSKDKNLPEHEKQKLVEYRKKYKI